MRRHQRFQLLPLGFCTSELADFWLIYFEMLFDDWRAFVANLSEATLYIVHIVLQYCTAIARGAILTHPAGC